MVLVITISKICAQITREFYSSLTYEAPSVANRKLKIYELCYHWLLYKDEIINL